MLDKEDQCWLGTEARLELWKQIDSGIEIGPVMYHLHPDKPAKEEKYILFINAVCRILSLSGHCSNKCIRHLQQKLIEGRRSAYKK